MFFPHILFSFPMDLRGTGGVWISDSTGTADAASDGAAGREASFVAGKGINGEIVSFDYWKLYKSIIKLYMLIYL